MPFYRIMAYQSIDGSLVNLFIEEGIKIHKIALVCIPAPDPPVALNTVEMELPGIKVQSVQGGFIDPVKKAVGTFKISPLFNRKVFIKS